MWAKLNYPSTIQRVMGIEPTLSAWKAEVLPLNYTREAKTWRGKDSNLRRQSRQIYSLIPLTAREPLHKTKPGIVIYVPTPCQYVK
jgi:hypothetical protein